MPSILQNIHIHIVTPCKPYIRHVYKKALLIYMSIPKPCISLIHVYSTIYTIPADIYTSYISMLLYCLACIMAVPSRTRLPDQHIKPAGNKKECSHLYSHTLNMDFFIMPVIFFALVLRMYFRNNSLCHPCLKLSCFSS